MESDVVSRIHFDRTSLFHGLTRVSTSHFQLEDKPTTGSIETTTQEKIQFAKTSMDFNKGHTVFTKHFPELVDPNSYKKIREESMKREPPKPTEGPFQAPTPVAKTPTPASKPTTATPSKPPAPDVPEGELLECTSCQQKKPKTEFTKAQTKAGIPDRKCKACQDQAAAAALSIVKCSACEKELPKADFSASQLKLKAKRKCKHCVVLPAAAPETK